MSVIFGEEDAGERQVILRIYSLSLQFRPGSAVEITVSQLGVSFLVFWLCTRAHVLSGFHSAAVPGQLAPFLLYQESNPPRLSLRLNSALNHSLKTATRLDILPKVS